LQQSLYRTDDTIDPGPGSAKPAVLFPFTSIENHLGGNLESMFMQCQKPTLQKISLIVEQLRLEKDVF
jgi:hypothetical protein